MSIELNDEASALAELTQQRIPDRYMADFTALRTVDEERLHRKQRLAAAFRLFSKCGFDEGVAGHITARDPGNPNLFWVNPFAMHFSQIRVSDLICVDDHGNVVEGTEPVNRAAYVIHSHVHQARPDVVAAAHAHSLYAKTLSSLPMLIEPLTQDACAFYDDNVRFDDFSGIVIDVEEGKKIAATLGERKAIILRNHGLLTVGQTVDEAAWWFITGERSCQSQLMAYAAGTPTQIDHENATLTRMQVGLSPAGWFNFQPLYERITREQPDLFD
jgi:ribulose-5-phosphate 4-epimerase/fuculose-1-phosphate aldolase